MAKTKQGKKDVESYTIKGTTKVVRVGDCVLMRASDTEKAPYVRRVERLETDGRGSVRVRWYYRPEESKGGRRQFYGAKELFLSDHFDTQSAHTIEGKYCKCEMPYNPDDLMVQCEGCKDWFHPSCMGMTIEQAKILDHFLCADCVKENGTKRPSNSYPASSNSDSKGGEVQLLTVDHCLEKNAEERERVTTSGGEVGPLRCWTGGMCLSRSIGDIDVGEFIVPIPHVKQVKLSNIGGRLIIASDGIWDALPSEAASKQALKKSVLLEEPIRMTSILERSKLSFFPAMTKIVGTLGPKSHSVDTISSCLKAGMSDAEYHQETLEILKLAIKSTKKLWAVMLDTVGPELQVVNKSKASISLLFSPLTRGRRPPHMYCQLTSLGLLRL
ncbi:hypothetical protein OsI_31247 [Oryza sativa Indica Group]|nr:hypothetical protein OsI_31247 [Oryza sativa Indica Group]